jgi:hypothetical protein
MKLTIAEATKTHSSLVNSLAKPLPWRIDEKSKNSHPLAQWQLVNGKLQCRWFVA